MQKTYKRETAWFLLVAVLIMAVSTAFYPEIIPAFETLVYPSFIFIMGAFGLDAWAKQINYK